MKLLVAVKRVLDYNVKVRVKSDGSDVELANVKMGINPFCEIYMNYIVILSILHNLKAYILFDMPIIIKHFDRVIFCSVQKRQY